ncbi:enoyl-CoA hydratase [Oceanobacillus sp. 143]|uniref:Enoyl-CoA hydratase n=1 Tax=Oceanobacillus zhaokaii TaxID=2052660 RepID=A0A345PHZ8_9BACI|nr:enoyl-CoA hydratase [Oceanobacillus zhaokaii]AXI09628.1 enoyl-CoA hydratase [Oceanobacillus zhaokaii]QGS68981.1 enoyl-CoA hydratase [Oceanobacillus sp. 143]
MAALTYEEENQIARLTIQSPPANALSSTLIHEVNKALDKIENEGNVKVVVLEGKGRFFSAGADIKEFTSLQATSDYRALSENGQQVFNRIENFPIPMIAAIHGAALGGGLELAMACHIRIVTETAKLGLPEITLGIIPGFAGTQRLPRLVGAAKAYELILTGEPISGIEAYQLGLANQVVADEELLNVTNELATKIAAKSRATINHIMHLLSYAKHEAFDKGMKEEAIAFSDVFGREDAKEGIQAFLEKRKPYFQDK